MGVLLGRLVSDRWRLCELLVIAGLIALFAVASTFRDMPLCPFRHFLGWSCPTCGTTRSVWAILHGNLAAAWGFNPIGFIVVIALVRRSAALFWPKFRWVQIANGDLPSLVLLIGFFVLGYARFVHVL